MTNSNNPNAQQFVLIGPHAGKTMHVNNHEFADGRFDFYGNHDQIASLTRVFSFYGAVPAKEAELLELRAQAAKATAPTKAVSQAPNVDQVVGTVDTKLAETTAQASAAALAAALGEDEAAPKGPTPELPDLAEAIGALDPEADAHWTSNNLPSLDYLFTLTGKKFARSDVEAVAEGYTRSKARAARA